MAKKPKLFDIFPGALPEEMIYNTLEIEIDPGDVKFSAPAQKHAYKGHPEDVPLIIPHLSQIISDPMYVGDDFRNPGKIELVRQIPGSSGKSALVAVTVEKGDDGYYHVCSSYLINQSEVDRKRFKGILKNVKKKQTS